MPRTFKQWTPAAAELELLHECWLARLPRGLPGRNLPGRASRTIKRRPAARAHLRRIAGRAAGSHYLFLMAGGGECGPVKIEIKSN
jgi:hypothetical protein